jgi:hypothetical protein
MLAKSHPKGKIYMIFFSRCLVVCSSSCPHRDYVWDLRQCAGHACICVRCTGLLWLKSKRDATHNWESVMSRASPAGTPCRHRAPHTSGGNMPLFLRFARSLARLPLYCMYIAAGPLQTSPAAAAAKAKQDL